MKQLRFTKGHGTGNDFILIDNQSGALDLSAAEIARLCDRHFGVGADGLIFVTETKFSSEVRHLLDEEPGATWFMDYRNADGSRAEMCGNGARVFARYLVQNELVKVEDGKTIPIATRAGIRDITTAAVGFAVDLGEFRVDYSREVLITAKGLPVPRPSLSVNVGNPHQVVAVADTGELERLDLTSQPQFEPHQPEGANVEFVVPMGLENGVGHISMRVHERGVGETLSCGTGIAAAAIAVRHWGESPQNHWRVQVPGGVVGVRIWPSENGERVSISGPAELVFEGVVNLPE